MLRINVHIETVKWFSPLQDDTVFGANTLLDN